MNKSHHSCAQQDNSEALKQFDQDESAIRGTVADAGLLTSDELKMADAVIADEREKVAAGEAVEVAEENVDNRIDTSINAGRDNDMAVNSTDEDKCM